LKGWNMSTAFAALLALTLAAPPPAFANTPDAADDQVICKLVERPASRFLRRLCGTKAQWDRMSEQHKAVYNEIQNRPVIYIGK
jgi:predicted secreted protein